MSEKKHILFVDDEPLVLDALRRALKNQREMWDMHFAQSVDEALEKVQTVAADVVITDVNMPGRDGFDLLAALQGAQSTHDIPVIILTGIDERDLKRRALQEGAVDLLNKPFITEDLIARIGSVLRIKAQQDQLKLYNDTLEQHVAERTAELEQSRVDIIWRLAKAGEYRDECTGNHVVRVSCCSRVLAEQLGQSRGYVEMIFLTSPLHDIGKIGIPDTILLKPGSLTDEERRCMQQHCEIGYEILQQIPLGMPAFYQWRDSQGSPSTRSQDNPFLVRAASIAMTHHEKWDGSGYPRGLRGEDIPLDARLVAIADVYDALSHARPYKPALPEQKVLDIMREGAGSHFDPQVFEAFEKARDEFRAIKEEYADPPIVARAEYA